MEDLIAYGSVIGVGLVLGLVPAVAAYAWGRWAAVPIAALLVLGAMIGFDALTFDDRTLSEYEPIPVTALCPIVIPVVAAMAAAAVSLRKRSRSRAEEL